MLPTAAPPHRRLPHRLHLFYANRAPEYAAFLDELRGLQDVNPNFRLVPVTGFILGG